MSFFLSSRTWYLDYSDSWKICCMIQYDHDVASLTGTKYHDCQTCLNFHVISIRLLTCECPDGTAKKIIRNDLDMRKFGRSFKSLSHCLVATWIGIIHVHCASICWYLYWYDSSTRIPVLCCICTTYGSLSDYTR